MKLYRNATRLCAASSVARFDDHGTRHQQIKMKQGDRFRTRCTWVLRARAIRSGRHGILQRWQPIMQSLRFGKTAALGDLMMQARYVSPRDGAPGFLWTCASAQEMDPGVLAMKGISARTPAPSYLCKAHVWIDDMRIFEGATPLCYRRSEERRVGKECPV